MATLNVTDFSCLKEVVFELAPVNIIIGPQGSGKSVTTKLFYFFSDMLNSFLQSAERGDSIEEYKKTISKQFCVWFPPSAWGQGRFNINYSASSFSIRILRRKKGGRLADDVSVTFSEWFANAYEKAREQFEISKYGDDIGITAPVGDTIERGWRIRDLVYKDMFDELGDEYLSRQTFIPAGRAFFTSIGRIVAGLEQASSLDPVTIKFARLVAAVRDRSSRRGSARLSRLGEDFLRKREEFMGSIFGGEIVFDNEFEYIKTNDGRKIPFTALSSGQQEILPMWSLMDSFNEQDAFFMGASLKNSVRYPHLVYIEEPEAHLFPSAQSLLMEFLIGTILSEKNKRSLILTTHSPYIMAKMNVFLKAGQLARRKKKNNEIAEIVPRDCWINERQISALALEDGRMRKLIDEDGIIDGDYLDSVSEEISREFSELLYIESEM